MNLQSERQTELPRTSQPDSSFEAGHSGSFYPMFRELEDVEELKFWPISLPTSDEEYYDFGVAVSNMLDEMLYLASVDPSSKSPFKYNCCDSDRTHMFNICDKLGKRILRWKQANNSCCVHKCHLLCQCCCNSLTTEIETSSGAQIGQFLSRKSCYDKENIILDRTGQIALTLISSKTNDVVPTKKFILLQGQSTVGSISQQNDGPKSPFIARFPMNLDLTLKALLVCAGTFYSWDHTIFNKARD
ncbi:unnamed protein product [Clavelina lepadiformis]|uniref:Phospholipid scramblase n=1 Tax=Clavelina lepadiformis TaxID=159417 RepID=A0ABP0F0G6_CLALP